MYINNISILYYLLVGLIGIGIGQFIDWCTIRLPEYKKVFVKDYWGYLKNSKPKYLYMIITAVLFVAILYLYGFSINTLKYFILVPMLICALIIDYRLKIIPNRLNLSLFEIGLVLTFIQGITNINIAIDMLLGMLAGGGIFLLITLLGGLVYGKEAMGLGDVKLMGALGLYFGLTNIIIISLVSFLVCAIISIFLLTTKIKKTDEYIPFGPFIVIGAFVSIFVPYASLVGILMNIFTLGLYSKNN